MDWKISINGSVGFHHSNCTHTIFFPLGIVLKSTSSMKSLCNTNFFLFDALNIWVGCFFFHSFLTIELIFADSSKVIIQHLVPQRKAVNIVVYIVVCSLSFSLSLFIQFVLDTVKMKFSVKLTYKYSIFLRRLFLACHFMKCMTFVATSNRQSKFC